MCKILFGENNYLFVLSAAHCAGGYFTAARPRQQTARLYHDPDVSCCDPKFWAGTCDLGVRILRGVSQREVATSAAEN